MKGVEYIGDKFITNIEWDAVDKAYIIEDLRYFNKDVYSSYKWAIDKCYEKMIGWLFKIVKPNNHDMHTLLEYAISLNEEEITKIFLDEMSK